MKLKLKGFFTVFLCNIVFQTSLFAAHAPTCTTKNCHRVPSKLRHHKKISKRHRAHQAKKRHWAAERVTKSNHFELMGAFGSAKLNAGNSQLGITSSETDSLVQTNRNEWSTVATQLGVGYVFYSKKGKQYSKKTQWFPALEPQLNLFYLSSESIKGNVYRFNSPLYNDLTFDMPVHSTRLMLDLALTVATYNRFSVYVKGGLGPSWTRVAYNDSVNSDLPCPPNRLSLDSDTQFNFAFEAGAGLIYALNQRYGLSFEYLFTDLGKVKPGSTVHFGTITTPIISPTAFKLRTQTALLGLHVAL